MKLLIACLLIHHMGLPWWMHLVAFAIYGLKVVFTLLFAAVSS